MIEAAVGEFINGWAPAGEIDAHGTLVLAVLKSAVVAAGPRSVREARSALRWGYDYLTAVGITATTADVFSAGPVEAYVAALDAPTGTKDAIRSHLRRMHPSICFAGTTRTTKTTTNTTDTTSTTTATTITGGAVAPAVPEAADTTWLIDGWAPATLSAERWNRVAPLVTTATAACHAATRARATDLARCVAYLAAWCDNMNQPLRNDVVLTAASIEAFLTVLADAGLPVASRRTFAANLHAVREANGLPLDVTRMRFPKIAPNEPYTASEIIAIYDTAERIRHPQRRQHVQFALDLLFGAGALPSETALVRSSDLATGATHVTLSKPERTVPILPGYRDRLATVSGGGDEFVLGGTSTNRRHRFRQILAPTTTGDGGVTVNGSRTRATWLVAAATTPDLFPTMAGLWEASGLRTLETFNHLAHHIRPARTGPAELAQVLGLRAVDDDEAAGWAVAS